MLTHTAARVIYPFIRLMRFLTPVGDLIARVWIAQIFFISGVLKLQSWDTTLTLFEYEYRTPLLSPYLAAVLGTATELVLPVLLAVGLGGRFWIFALFIYNIVAVASYPFLWTPQGAEGLEDHTMWGILLMLLMFHGSGKLSLDYWIHKKHGHLLK